MIEDAPTKSEEEKELLRHWPGSVRYLLAYTFTMANAFLNPGREIDGLNAMLAEREGVCGHELAGGAAAPTTMHGDSVEEPSGLGAHSPETKPTPEMSEMFTPVGEPFMQPSWHQFESKQVKKYEKEREWKPAKTKKHKHMFS